MLVLSGCSMVRDAQTGLLPTLRELQLDASTPSEEKEVESMMQQIVAALDARDKGALRDLFSEKTLSEADDMDAGLDYIMDTYQGMSQTYEANGNDIQDHYGSPGRTKHIIADGEIETTVTTYTIFFEDHMIDEADSEAVGLTFIKLIEEDLRENENERRYSVSYGGRVGIYNPGWDVAVQDDSE